MVVVTDVVASLWMIVVGVTKVVVGVTMFFVDW
jgi:hypothetical protein